MRRRLPPLNSLLAFEVAARHGSFTRAARELGVAQPAVTRHVANLEDWLGAKLFKRHGNSVELSKDGYAVAEMITPVFDRMELGLSQFSSTPDNEIVIGASFGIMHMWLMPKLTAMRGAARGATINFLTSENYADFNGNGVDLSVRFGSGDWPGKHAQLMFTETTYVIASPEFLENNPDLDANKLAATLKPEWLLDHGDPYNYGWMTWKLWFEYQGHKDLKSPTSSELHNYPNLLDMVRCSEGVALGYVGLDDHLVEAGEVVRLGQPLHRPEYGYFLVSNLEGRNSKELQELRDFLADAG